MALTRELNELACRLGKSAEFARSDAMRDLERTVCGCDYGSTSGTTRMLRACRRVAADGARMVFTVIALAPSLADAERRIAIESGPKFVDVEDDCGLLLSRSGWCLQERTDLTAALLQYMRTELDGMQSRAGVLTGVFGSDELTERMKRQQATIAAIDSGFLRRELFVARAGR